METDSVEVMAKVGIRAVSLTSQLLHVTSLRQFEMRSSQHVWGVSPVLSCGAVAEYE